MNRSPVGMEVSDLVMSVTVCFNAIVHVGCSSHLLQKVCMRRAECVRSQRLLHSDALLGAPRLVVGAVL